MKRRWLPLLVLVALALPFAACGSDDDDGGDSGRLAKVTVMLDWTPNTNHAGLFIAQEKGFYREAGLDVTIAGAPASGGTEQVVGAGRADFGVSVQEAVIPAREQGVPVVSIAAVIQHNTSSLFSLKSEGINRPRDLEGKTYGGFGGALETEIIKRLVTCDGGDASKVKFVEVGDVDFLVGFEQNRFDFAWIFDGWDGIRATQVEKKETSTIRFIDHTDCIPDWYTPVLITNEDMVRRHPDLVRAFMEATSRGYQEAITNPEASAQAILDAAPETDRTLVEASAKYLAQHYVDSGRQWGLQDREVWVRFEQFVREAGLTSKEVDVDTSFSNDFLPK